MSPSATADQSSHLRTSASATLDGEWAVPLYACQEVWEWSCAQAMYTAAISLVCVYSVCCTW